MTGRKKVANKPFSEVFQKAKNPSLWDKINTPKALAWINIVLSTLILIAIYVIAHG